MAADEPLLIEGYLPRLMMGNSDIRETRLDLRTNVSNGIGLNVNSYLVQDNGFINVRLDSDAAGNKLDNHIFIDLEQGKEMGRYGSPWISCVMKRSACLRYPDTPTNLMFNGKRVDVNDAVITYRKERITIDNFGLREENMLLLYRGCCFEK